MKSCLLLASAALAALAMASALPVSEWQQGQRMMAKRGLRDKNDPRALFQSIYG